MDPLLRRFARNFTSKAGWTSKYFYSTPSTAEPTATPPLLNGPRAVFVGLISLGASALVWFNLQKAEERDVVAEKTLTALETPPKPLPKTLSPEEYKELLYRPFFVTGELLHGMELRLTAQRRAGALGAHIITPIKRSDTGSVILVNRGWVPPELINPSTRREAQVTGLVTVLGNLVPGDKPQGFEIQGKASARLENQLDKNIWYWKDLDTMAKMTGAEPILLDVQVDPPNPGGYPVGGQTRFPVDKPYRKRAAMIGGAAITIVLGTLFIGRIFPRFAVQAAVPKVWTPKPPPSTPFKK